MYPFFVLTLTLWISVFPPSTDVKTETVAPVEILLEAQPLTRVS